MAGKYEQAPVIEAVCEFRFDAEGWDWTIPGLLYNETRGEFPTKRDNVTFGIEAGSAGEVKGTTQRTVRLVREDETAYLEVGENVLAVHQLVPYRGWINFRPVIEGTLRHYLNIARPRALTRVGLRYINRLVLPGNQVSVASYVNFAPRIPTGLPLQMRALFCRVELFYRDDNGLLLLTLGSADKGGLMLDLDFVTLDASRVPLDDVMTWIDTAHARVETAFEASLKDATRQLFKPKMAETSEQ